ncbi:arrestin domain-containing protein 2-like [Chironomus tepperi]|uniref:arrestin domain-containing protein 2-like n=1 Tax=Chironomus tepperi TaxID=113505 RepID=UPI00391F001F
MSAITLTPCSYFNIKFENNTTGIFHPGDTMNGLKLEVVGIANCAWTKRKIYKTVKYEGSQKFMEHVSHFFGRVDGAAIEVSVGVHLYKFSCVIPITAVSSYEGTYGSIKYSMKVTLDIPHMRDIVYEKPFTIVRMENLNNFPWLRCKSDSETDVGDGIDCCETMPLVVSMKISKSGFVAGEELKTRIEACNQGPSKYSKTTLTLFRTETCSSQFPIISTKKSFFPIAVTSARSIKPFESTFFEQSLMIPKELHGSSPISSETVRIGYVLRFCTKSNRRTTVKTDIPVFIGHIPFVEKNDDDKDECDKHSEPVKVNNGRRSHRAELIEKSELI